jgi:4-hydroxybenzoate polyprenyltransferase
MSQSLVQPTPRTEGTPPPSEAAPLARRRPWPLLLLKTMRPKQWIKNVFVVAALIFSFQLMHPEPVLRTALAFLIFCLVSSAVYIMNDWGDRKQDALHPRKRSRPLASGELNPNIALTAIVVILAFTFPLAFLLNWQFGLITLVYFVTQIAYTFLLKHMVIIDVMIVASGFVIRAMAGALAIEVPISPWLYVCVTLLALFQAISKRRHELILLNEGTGSFRKILAEYSPAFLDQMISMVTASTVIAYALYTFTADNLPKPVKDSHLMMLTIPFVIYAIFRYLYLIYQKDEGGSPEELLLRDRPLLVCIVLWGLTSVAILYSARL